VRADGEAVGVELERREPRAERDVERPARPVEQGMGGGQALERALADPRVLPGGEVVDPRDVAVRDESAELLLETVREQEGGVRRLLGVDRVVVRAEDLEDGGHGTVGEAVESRARPPRSHGGARVVGRRQRAVPGAAGPASASIRRKSSKSPRAA
jgi:hypothetical protein